MVDACTRCGKCVEVCPATGPAGLTAEQRIRQVIDGIIDILRHGEGNEAARKWASGCLLSGECIKACDYGVNPRFLLNMARVKWRAPRTTGGATPRRRRGLPQGRARGAAYFAAAARRRAAGTAGAGRQAGLRHAGMERRRARPDFVFYTGCNVLKTPHIALLALDIMDALGITYDVMGGPTHCCGMVQMRTGDVATSGRVAENTHRQAGAEQDRTGGVVVPVVPRAVHRDDVADDREDARRQAVRDDAVHDVPAQAPRPAAADAARARADADRAASASRHSRRGRGGRGYFARRAGHRDSSISISRRSGCMSN